MREETGLPALRGLLKSRVSVCPHDALGFLSCCTLFLLLLLACELHLHLTKSVLVFLRSNQQENFLTRTYLSNHEDAEVPFRGEHTPALRDIFS